MAELKSQADSREKWEGVKKAFQLVPMMCGVYTPRLRGRQKIGKNRLHQQSSRRGQRSAGHRWASEHWSHQPQSPPLKESSQENWVVGSHDDVKSYVCMSAISISTRLLSLCCSLFLFWFLFVSPRILRWFRHFFFFKFALRNTRYRSDKAPVGGHSHPCASVFFSCSWLFRLLLCGSQLTGTTRTFGTFSVPPWHRLHDGADHPTLGHIRRRMSNFRDFDFSAGKDKATES